MNRRADPYRIGYEHYRRQMTKKWPEEIISTWDELSEDERMAWRAGFEEYEACRETGGRCPERDSMGAPCEFGYGHEPPCGCPDALKAFREMRARRV